MEIGDLIAIVFRTLVVVSVVIFVCYTYFRLKKVSEKKCLYRTLIVAVDIFVISVTLLPCYIILPGKIDVSGFDSVIDYNQTAKEENYSFETEKYGGNLFVDDVESLEEYISIVKKNSIKGITFKGKENEINWLCTPVIAERDMSLLGCRYDVTGALVLWDDKNVVYINYWYKAKGLFIHTLTFPELFFKESVDLNDIICSISQSGDG